jgi:hypothetical protein
MTQSSVRKHISQMSLEEVDFFTSLVRNKAWIMSGHVREQMEKRGGTLSDIIEAIEYGSLVEYHCRNGYSRLLFRSETPIHNWVPCVVVEIATERIITIFWNHVKDNHRTIDMSRYNEDLDIIAMFKEE